MNTNKYINTSGYYCTNSQHLLDSQHLFDPYQPIPIYYPTSNTNATVPINVGSNTDIDSTDSDSSDNKMGNRLEIFSCVALPIITIIVIIAIFYIITTHLIK